jgi:hypothetical protein
MNLVWFHQIRSTLVELTGTKKVFKDLQAKFLKIVQSTLLNMPLYSLADVCNYTD